MHHPQVSHPPPWYKGISRSSGEVQANKLHHSDFNIKHDCRVVVVDRHMVWAQGMKEAQAMA